MKRVFGWVPASLFLGVGTVLLLSGIAPFVADFGNLETQRADLQPRVLRLLGGLLLFVFARIGFQISRANK